VFLAMARKEFAELARDGRFRWMAAIVLGLVGVAIAAGARYQREVIRERETAELAERERWLGQEEKNPHSAAHHGVYAFRPRLSPGFVDPGVEPYTGVAVWLEAHHQNEMLFRPARDATSAQRFGDLTAALMLQVVMPLVIVLLGFGALAGEKERGTLRQLLAVGAQPRDLVLGKISGILLALACVGVPVLVMGLAALAFAGPFTGVGRFVSLVVLHSAWLAVWVFLTLGVSARARTQRSALVLLLVVWAAECLIAPRVLAEQASALHGLPDPVDHQARLDAALSDPDGAAALLAERTASLMEAHGVARAEDLPLNLAGVRLQTGEEHGYEMFDRFRRELEAPMEAQNRFLSRAGLAFPLLGVHFLSTGLAGTDLAHQQDFSRAAEEHRREIQRIMNEDITAHPVPDGETHVAGRELWARVPPFEYRPPALASVLARNRGTLAILAVWLFGSAAFALRGAAKLRAV
jgi:ABC-2 type transport system permease protein